MYFATAIVSHDTCSHLILLVPTFVLINTVASQLLVAARTLALGERSISIAVVIGFIMLFETAIIIAGITRWGIISDAPSGVSLPCIGGIVHHALDLVTSNTKTVIAGPTASEILAAT